MLKNYVKIRKSDEFRAILTDVLPYEVPLLFSNEGLYKFLKSHNKSVFREKFNIDLLDAPSQTIPYNYKIKKNQTEFRVLSVMHPAQQIKVAAFYKKYSGMILAQCQKSNWSLRAPASVATYYFERHLAKKATKGRAGSVETERSGFESSPITASSYFAYKHFNLLYKFFESSEFHKLERKFPLLLRLDISQCFNRIYTHTVCWAVKSKDFAKDHRQHDNFENAFDKLMQNANHQETAGIIVGPEVSRIFAEIVLQQIDIDVEAKLSDGTRLLESGRDYEVRRYVDDYFVFARSTEDLTLIQLAISECLAPYRLSLNESKTNSIRRPFSSPETTTRIEISKIMANLFERSLSSEVSIDPENGKEKKTYKPTRMSNPERTSNLTIRDIKIAIHSNNSVFDTASNYFFSTTKRLVIRHTEKLSIDKLDQKHEDWATNFLISVIDILFFFYASSPRVRQTYLISEIILTISDYFKAASPRSQERIHIKIAQEINSTILSTPSNHQEDNIETLNILLALQQLGEEYSLDEPALARALMIQSKDGSYLIPNDFGYFQAATSIYLSSNRQKYKNIYGTLISHLKNKFQSDKKWAEKSEMVMLILDICSCPFIESKQKEAIVKAALRHNTSQARIGEQAREFIGLASPTEWFFNWSKDVRLSDALRKKELRTPY